jgi:prepilin-type N-terminal cleavage/methylation domain-containing protein
MKITLKNSGGFTLVELLLAMTLFSSVMVVATVGFIGMNRAFTRGTIKKQLSESVQLVTDEASRSIRQGSVLTEPLSCSESDSPTKQNCPSGWSALCFASNVRFFWKSVGDDTTSNSLYKDTSNDCSKAPNVATAARLMGPRFRMLQLVAEPVGAAGLVRLKGVATTVDRAALTELVNNDPTSVQCQGSANAASRTCAVESFSFIVGGRAVKQ